MDPVGVECLRKLQSFMCGLSIKKLFELVDGGVDSACIVPVWFDSVVEGVDMWFNDDQSKDMARFRMKMKVKHGEHVAVFAVFDQELSSVFNVLQEESCSLYPDEIECFYGDAYLCKVQGRDPVDFDDLPAFDVLSVCCEVGVVNMFFDEFIPDVDKFIDVPTCDSIKELEDYGFNHYSYVGSNNSDDAADEYVNAVIADDNVVGEVGVKDQYVIGVRGNNPIVSQSQARSGRRVSKHGMSTYVEKFVYSKRKSCIKRNLNFDEKVEEVGKKIKMSKGSEDVDV
ncbi:hypothetical protein QL285_093299 [Trifolium repens]|nr:hypothetical protein QL285_093299 [Trifolium repens]